MAEIIGLRRKPRPLRATYEPNAPYIVEREDQDDGYIAYEVVDTRPESYRTVCGITEFDNDHAKHEAEQIARALNLMVQYKLEVLLPTKEDEI